MGPLKLHMPGKKQAAENTNSQLQQVRNGLNMEDAAFPSTLIHNTFVNPPWPYFWQAILSCNTFWSRASQLRISKIIAATPENIVKRVVFRARAPENIVKRVTFRARAPENIVKRVVFRAQAPESIVKHLVFRTWAPQNARKACNLAARGRKTS